MAQSNVIAFCLFFAFIVFITLRGEMPRYLDVLFKTQSSGSGGSSGGSTGGGSGATVTAASVANDPIGAAAGALRRSLGIQNGLLGNILPSIFGTGE